MGVKDPLFVDLEACEGRLLSGRFNLKIFSEHEFERDRKTGRDRRSPVRAPRAKTESPVQSEESEGEGLVTRLQKEI